MNADRQAMPTGVPPDVMEMLENGRAGKRTARPDLQTRYPR
jgi:hypothetical protein